MSTYLITGTSRGLGLGQLRHLLSKPSSEVDTVYATARTNTAELQEVIKQSAGRAIFVPLDVTLLESVRQAAETVKSDSRFKHLDVLINNAAHCFYDSEPIEKMYVSLSFSA